MKFAREHSNGRVRELALLRLRFPKAKWKNFKEGWVVLVESLNDPIWYIRRAAILALGHRYYDDNSQVVAGLIGAMAEKRQDVRQAAYWSLGRLAPTNKVVEGALFKKLRTYKRYFSHLNNPLHKDFHLMAEGLIWLPTDSDPAIRVLLVELFRRHLTHPDSKIRLYGLMRLEELSPEFHSAEVDMKWRLTDPDPLVRKIAKRALDRLISSKRREKNKK